ncbi:hypothetical protein QTH91_04720 [Variovorax dokdonensis]|uniref:Uncharacterized protein n=1 Tax=Variovorax dokdonensis TaxID=344883 RepID=A0ABT7N764_9BURK|nr:hypothetical protein [Variovorax dokdonensis]MDM0043778.1 hypothetical protein [Variovorax dokdonensis]
MSAADFLLAPEVQKILTILYASPQQPLAIKDLARQARLELDDAIRTVEHLARSGVLKTAHEPEDADTSSHAANDEDDAANADAGAARVMLDEQFVFYREFRSMALKSFAGAEPIRKMLMSKFKTSVLRAFILGEQADGQIELLVVYGQSAPDRHALQAACQKLSSTGIRRSLQVQVVSSKQFDNLKPWDSTSVKLASGWAVELIAPGQTKAAPPAPWQGLRQLGQRVSRMIG